MSELTPLPAWHAIVFDGPDAQKFLQGQIPTDVNKMAVGQASITSINVATGKVIGLGTLLRLSEEIFLLLIRGVAEAEEVYKHIKKFSVFSKVTITLENNVCVKAGFSPIVLDELKKNSATLAEKSPEALSSLLADLVKVKEETSKPEGTFATIYHQDKDLLIACVDGCHLTVDASTLDAIFSEKASSFSFPSYEGEVAINDNNFNYSRLLGYLNYLPQQYSNSFLPQAFNLDNLQACISFKKGCYQGQEGIARARYRGTNPHLFSTFICHFPTLGAEKAEEVVQAVQEGQYLLNCEIEAQEFKPTGKIIDQGAFTNQELAQALALSVNDKATLIVQVVVQKKLDPKEYPYVLIHKDSGEVIPLEVLPALEASYTALTLQTQA